MINKQVWGNKHLVWGDFRSTADWRRLEKCKLAGVPTTCQLFFPARRSLLVTKTTSGRSGSGCALQNKAALQSLLIFCNAGESQTIWRPFVMGCAPLSQLSNWFGCLCFDLLEIAYFWSLLLVIPPIFCQLNMSWRLFVNLKSGNFPIYR
jgi:hypothetical protein